MFKGIVLGGVDGLGDGRGAFCRSGVRWGRTSPQLFDPGVWRRGRGRCVGRCHAWPVEMSGYTGRKEPGRAELGFWVSGGRCVLRPPRFYWAKRDLRRDTLGAGYRVLGTGHYKLRTKENLPVDWLFTRTLEKETIGCITLYKTNVYAWFSWYFLMSLRSWPGESWNGLSALSHFIRS